ncbi:MAG: NgoMIV family type II restriction endonuclease [Chloroflexota bacterium]|nr:NgoMIV family type II restriction endonuclease [Chloroflexota bacterium]
MKIVELRQVYHRRLCKEIIRFRGDGETEYPNFADKGNNSSRAIASGIVQQLNCELSYESISGQTAGRLFESITRDFLEKAFGLLHHLRPGKWHYSVETPITDFDQYEHLAELERIVEQISALSSSLGGDYIIKPDIVIGREPVSDADINEEELVIEANDGFAGLTPLRDANVERQRLILHASISCKWTLRSDRSQNARAEALNLIRNRKGNLPHIVAVTAEPLPTRIASLALGTGDLDCVYHFALPELTKVIRQADNEDQMDMLHTLVEGRRLRDVSDLPFDLAI